MIPFPKHSLSVCPDKIATFLPWVGAQSNEGFGSQVSCSFTRQTFIEPLLFTRHYLGSAGTWQCANKTKPPVFMGFKFMANVEKEECKKCSESSEEGAVCDGGDGRRGYPCQGGCHGLNCVPPTHIHLMKS